MSATDLPRRRLPLDGEWLFRPDPKRLGEHYPQQLHYTHAHDARWCEPDADLAAWVPITVPGSWTAQGVRDVDCAWYRRAFEGPPRRPDERVLLAFDGVDYLADVWLNGHYLGSHEGYLGRFDFDVTDLVAEVNTLVLRVEAPDDVLGEEHEIGQLKRVLKGALGRWDMNDPASKPAGLWGSVSLIVTGRVRIESLRVEGRPVRLPEAGAFDEPVPVHATLAVTLSLEANAVPVSATLRYALRPVGFDGEAARGAVSIELLPGETTHSLSVALAAARLWWTWDLGRPHLYDVEITVSGEGVGSDCVILRTGFRHLAVEGVWDLRLNGVPLYQRGANYLSDLDLASMTRERYDRDVALFRGANLNTVHPFCVVEGDGLYDACDEAGLLVYQDLPFWTVSDPASEVVRSALRQFEEMVSRLGPHPSVAIWNFGSQPSVANMEKLCVALARLARRIDPSRIAHMGNSAISYDPRDDVHPTRSFFWREEDAARFEARYGWRRDCHMYPGWYFGDIAAIRDLPPAHFPLVTEFGAQSLPRRETVELFAPRLAGDVVPWSALALRCAQPDLLARNLGPVATLDELIERSQAYQADLIKHHVEYVRSLKGAPNHGLHLFAFNDCWPAVTWSVVEFDREPKQAYAALAMAMAPVQAFIFKDHDERGRLILVVVNDTPSRFNNARVRIFFGNEVNKEQTVVEIEDILPSSIQRRPLPKLLDGQSASDLVYVELVALELNVENRYCLKNMIS